jgi:hypothetical protein
MCNDAIDVFGSQHISITNSEIQSGDDNIALKVECGIYAARHMMDDLDCEDLEPVQDITVEGNTVYAPLGGNGLQIGWAAEGEISNVLWKDNIIRSGTKRPVSLWVRYIDENHTRIHEVYYENNRYEDGGLVPALHINAAQVDCQYYEVYWNGDLVDRYVQTAAECGGTTCSCGAWVDRGCGGGPCGPGEMYETRTCSPGGCETETRCIQTSACAVPNADINLDGNVDALDLQICIRVQLGVEKDSDLITRSDLNDDGVVDGEDTNEVIGQLLQR